MGDEEESSDISRVELVQVESILFVAIVVECELTGGANAEPQMLIARGKIKGEALRFAGNFHFRIRTRGVTGRFYARSFRWQVKDKI
jgi:hypothetical protein